MLSVVIPTFNAENGLERTLRLFDDFPEPCEIIMSDGGSSDQTVEIARRHGVTVVQGAKGRGNQMALGARHARGEWLLFLHADSDFADGWQKAVMTHCGGEGAQAAYFRFLLDDRGANAARILEKIVALRCKIGALPYGDQGLLISRDLYEEVGGFGDLPLMEDVDMVRRLGRKRLKGLEVGLITSAVRYRHHGYVKRMLRNLFCLCLFFGGVSPQKIARIYG